MARYIDADGLEETIVRRCLMPEWCYTLVKTAIKDAPTADVQEVRRGNWKKSYADHEAFGVRPFCRYCSECNEITVFPYKYCPNCGALMEE